MSIGVVRRSKDVVSVRAAKGTTGETTSAICFRVFVLTFVLRKSAKKPFKKKRDKDAKKKNPGKDPRAFALTRMGRVRVEMQRSADLVNKRIHVPVRDRLAEVDAAPPIVVAVCGPSGVGKTTLIKSLVKHYTKQNLSSVVGPVTVVAGKNRRLTFIECPNELTAMLDVAKVADLVMLLVDAKFGFEMEQFELLNMMQTHGFPKGS